MICEQSIPESHGKIHLKNSESRRLVQEWNSYLEISSLLHATEIFGIGNICSFEQMFYQKISRWLPLSLCVSTRCNIIYLQIKRPNNMI